MNNGTERLNEDLNYDELKGLKQSFLSEFLVILVNSSTPKRYKKYVEFNVRYGCKTICFQHSLIFQKPPKENH